MINLTPEEREIIEQMEARTRSLITDLERRPKETKFASELLTHFRAENKAYAIALEAQERETENETD